MLYSNINKDDQDIDRRYQALQIAKPLFFLIILIVINVLSMIDVVGTLQTILWHHHGLFFTLSGLAKDASDKIPPTLLKKCHVL